MTPRESDQLLAAPLETEVAPQGLTVGDVLTADIRANLEPPPLAAGEDVTPYFLHLAKWFQRLNPPPTIRAWQYTQYVADLLWAGMHSPKVAREPEEALQGAPPPASPSGAEAADTAEDRRREIIAKIMAIINPKISAARADAAADTDAARASTSERCASPEGAVDAALDPRAASEASAAPPAGADPGASAPHDPDAAERGAFLLKAQSHRGALIELLDYDRKSPSWSRPLELLFGDPPLEGGRNPRRLRRDLRQG